MARLLLRHPKLKRVTISHPSCLLCDPRGLTIAAAGMLRPGDLLVGPQARQAYKIWQRTWPVVRHLTAGDGHVGLVCREPS
jgi:hypothetical protein